MPTSHGLGGSLPGWNIKEGTSNSQFYPFTLLFLFLCFFASITMCAPLGCPTAKKCCFDFRYIYPPSFRARMADLWKMPELNDWWLPNGEEYPKIIHEIREWTKERKTDSMDEFR